MYFGCGISPKLVLLLTRTKATQLVGDSGGQSVVVGNQPELSSNSFQFLYGPPKSGHAMLVVKQAAKTSLSQPSMPWRWDGRGSLLIDGAMTEVHGVVRNKKHTARLPV